MNRLGHSLLVFAFLTALLSAPCMSALGLFGTGGGHAYHLTQGLNAANDHKAHGASHAHRNHGAPSLPALITADAQHDPAQQACCCRLCDGWLTKSNRDVVVATVPVRPDLLPVLARTSSAYPAGDLSTRAPPESVILQPSLNKLALRSVGKQAPYAATRRLRI